MLEIVTLSEIPLREVRYLNAAKRGGTEVCRLPILRGVARGLPEGVDALVATSDLQGVVPNPHTRESTLLGAAVAETLEELGETGVLPRAMRTAVVLAGDLYTVPAANKRGGYGDVSGVWAAFADRFASVFGVAGNHDDVSAVERSPSATLLDGERVDFGGVSIGGVGLVIGNTEKIGRRDEEEQITRIELVAADGLDVLILHEGPHGEDDQPGNEKIRAAVERARVGLTICGHVHWPRALAAHSRGKILNVDTRVVVLTR